MSKLVLAFGVTALGLSMGCAWLATRLQQQGIHNAALLDRIQALESMGSHEPAAFELTAPAAAAVLVERRSQPTSAGANPAPAANPLMQMAQRRQALLQDDILYSRALLAQQRRGMERLYADLGTALGLPPDEARTIIDLLAQQQVAMLNPRSPHEARRLQQSLEAIIVKQLGAQGPQRWREFENTLEVRHQLEAVRLELSLSQVPLREDQVEAMVTALAESDRRAGTVAVQGRTREPEQTARTATERLAALEQEMQLQEQVMQRKREAIAGYLSLEQRAHVDHLQKLVRDSYRSALQELQMAAQAEEQGAPPIAPSFAENRLAPPMFAMGSGLRLAFNGSLHVRATPTAACEELLGSELNGPATAPGIPTTQY